MKIDRWREGPEHNMYGNFPGGDPRGFLPDEDSAADQEICQWAGDCIRFDLAEKQGEEVPPEEAGSGWRHMESHVVVVDGERVEIPAGMVHGQWTKYGHGTYWIDDSEF